MTAGMDGGGGRATPALPAGASLEADALALERRFQHVTAALTAAASACGDGSTASTPA